MKIVEKRVVMFLKSERLLLGSLFKKMLNGTGKKNL